jgi:hypothetical protein
LRGVTGMYRIAGVAFWMAVLLCAAAFIYTGEW